MSLALYIRAIYKESVNCSNKEGSEFISAKKAAISLNGTTGSLKYKLQIWVHGL